jgi:hypothetical protein
MQPEKDQGSFRDKRGFVFYSQGNVIRAVNQSFQKDWEELSRSPLFRKLLEKKRIPNFTVSNETFGYGPEVSSTALVERVPFITWPSEWTFDQLQIAALLTLNVYKTALKEGYTLRDASAFNIQFNGHQPLFIDLFSFTQLTEGNPWEAYGQFCRHFLAPLALLHYKVPGVSNLMQGHIDGLPLALTSALLPARSKLSMALYTHIHLHAKYETRHAGNTRIEKSKLKISKERLKAVADHLYDTISGFNSEQVDTNWSDYYQNNSYSSEGEVFKRTFCENVLSAHPGHLCVDLGANSGEYARIAAKYFKQVVACDMDHTVVTAIYRRKTENILPLVINLENPTPAFGWHNKERKSFLERIAVSEMTMALALVHHLCIGNNVPVHKLAVFFAAISNQLIIEFVPKSDVQVSRLLVTREDVFADYTLQNFKQEFEQWFNILYAEQVPGSNRVLFFMQKKR